MCRRAGVVEGECAIEANGAGDGFSEFADSAVFAGANVDERWVGLREEGSADAFVEVEEKDACGGKVSGVVELAAGTSWADGERTPTAS